MAQHNENGFESVKYETGGASIDARIRTEDGTAWLTAAQIAELYGRDASRISRHIKKIVSADRTGTQSIFAPSARIGPSGKRYTVRFYSLDVALEVGRMIGSENGNLFREWFESYLGKAPGDTMIVYDAGEVSIDVRVSPSEEAVWLTQGQIAELFEVSRQNISLHIKSILDERELDDTMRKYYLHMTPNGRQYQTELYNLDMILAVGYRVRSKRAIEFRRWATSVLKRYLMKGYALEERRLSVVAESVRDLSSKVFSLSKDFHENVIMTDERISKLEQAASDYQLPKEKVFYDGEYFDARIFFKNLFSRAMENIIVVDPYADGVLLELLTAKKMLCMFVYYMALDQSSL